MLLLLIFTIVFFISLLLYYKTDSDVFSLITFMSGTVLLLAIIVFPIVYSTGISGIEKFKSIEKTIEIARESGQNIENAAIQLKIIEANAWLAKEQYWNKSEWVEIYIPDEVDELEPIK